MTTVETTTVKRHEYSSGREFWIVSCKACGSVLNSGHHYERVSDATRTANLHNKGSHS